MKERWGCLGLVILALGLSLVFPVFVHGEILSNEVPEEPLPPPPGGVQLNFDPNSYRFLVYDGGGETSQDLVQDAMDAIGIHNYTKPVRSPSNPVTLADLLNHDILIVGWTSGGSMAGLNPNILASGITGRVLLTGHDADFHTAKNLPEATTFFTQAIGYLLSAPGTGLLVCGDGDIARPLMVWLPETWGISATDNSGNTIASFTSEGQASGVYQGLEPSDLCDWTMSYHNTFTVSDPAFVPFEMGGDTGEDVITIARIYPVGPTVSKVDDKTGCVGPGDTITYTITVDPDGRNHQGVRVVDTLPKGVSYDSLISWSPPTIDPNYDATAHTYTWELGALSATHDPVVLSLTVTVNDLSDPTGELVNEVLAESDLGRTVAWERTAVCCRDAGRILYVDAAATGANMGASWADAYTDLQRAFERVRNSDCGLIDEIRIARGEYGPGEKVGDTFAIPPGVSVYGGYHGGRIDPNERKPKEYRTILTGRINEFRRSETVVTMGNNTLLDGVTVREAGIEGIRGNQENCSIKHCVVENNLQRGINIENVNAFIEQSVIQHNGYEGIYHSGAGKTLMITNCQIKFNKQNGIGCVLSVPIVRNTVICGNGFEGDGYFGLVIGLPSNTPVIQNTTIAYNRNAGLSYVDNDPNYVNKPDIQNCILWYNNQTGNGSQFSGYRAPTHYSCIYDPNDPAGTNTTLDANSNFSHKPDFAYSNEPNNVHLAANSFCINKGNPNLPYAGQQDIDGEERVMGSFVDIGADEVNPECADVYNAYDWNADGVINLYEFDMLSRAWQSRDPNDPGMTDPNECRNWNLRCNINQTGASQYWIDLADLIAFAHDIHWGWVACWRLDLQPEQLGMMAPPMQMLSLQATATDTSVVLTPQITTPEKPIQEQIVELKDTVEFLERLWLDDPSIRSEIDPIEWQQFMDKVYGSMKELQDIRTNVTDNTEELQ